MGCREWRRVSRRFHRSRAVTSAARMAEDESWEAGSWGGVGSVVNEEGKVRELAAIKDFCRRMRVLRRASKEERCCLTAFPLARSALAAAEMVATTEFCDSAINLRRVVRSSELGVLCASGEVELRVLVLTPLLGSDLLSASSKMESVSFSESASLSDLDAAAIKPSILLSSRATSSTVASLKSFSSSSTSCSKPSPSGAADSLYSELERSISSSLGWSSSFPVARSSSRLIRDPLY